MRAHRFGSWLSFSAVLHAVLSSSAMFSMLNITQKFAVGFIIFVLDCQDTDSGKYYAVQDVLNYRIY